MKRPGSDAMMGLLLALGAASCAPPLPAAEPDGPLVLGEIELTVDAASAIDRETREACADAVQSAFARRGFVVDQGHLADHGRRSNIRVDVAFGHFAPDYQPPIEAAGFWLESLPALKGNGMRSTPVTADLRATFQRAGHTETIRAAAEGEAEQGPRDLASREGRAQAYACSLAGERLVDVLAKRSKAP